MGDSEEDEKLPEAVSKPEKEEKKAENTEVANLAEGLQKLSIK